MSAPNMKTINVNQEGLDAEGNSYDHVASRRMVDAGYMINEAVVLSLPDGRKIDGTRVLITPAGLEFLKAEWARHGGARGE
ncbi:MAG: hypothetical protein KF899_04280 [Parvibaculum sp.]|nr:hypothetical protein [Parvibaculum sp.]